ncbi:MAG: A/G-specific adenine glycosylase [Spirochaetia bacterium]|nr:A/G-specific adenine glycosylase [Spirochaetia bacterium]
MDRVSRFKTLIRTHYRRFGRSFPWRETRDPYGICVSEIMLQQTQTERVLKKYPPFIAAFPSFESLAAARLGDVLALWQGLGYNRRAKALREIAVAVCADFGGVLPGAPDILRGFPGIGPATAGSLAAFAYNKPSVFIETNIRRVFLHFFFEGRENVHDREILPLVEASLDKKNPRTWYYGLMDYGVYLKTLYPNANKRSAHYAPQSRFENSNRQVRGAIIKALTQTSGKKDRYLSLEELTRKTGFGYGRVKKAAEALAAEDMVAEKEERYGIS